MKNKYEVHWRLQSQKDLKNTTNVIYSRTAKKKYSEKLKVLYRINLQLRPKCGSMFSIEVSCHLTKMERLKWHFVLFLVLCIVCVFIECSPNLHHMLTLLGKRKIWRCGELGIFYRRDWKRRFIYLHFLIVCKSYNEYIIRRNISQKTKKNICMIIL